LGGATPCTAEPSAKARAKCKTPVPNGAVIGHHYGTGGDAADETEGRRSGRTAHANYLCHLERYWPPATFFLATKIQ
jgi:hypothetical protein